MFKQPPVMLIIIVLLLSTACWGTPAERPTQDELGKAYVHVSFAVPDWELEQGHIYELVKQFEAQNPGIRVEIKPFTQVLGLSSTEEFEVTDDFWLKLASGADVFRVIFLNGIDRQPVDNGQVRDLKPFIIDTYTTFDPDDFYAGALEAGAWDGGVWAIPTALDYALILFDKQAFDTAGVPYPKAGWTWDDLAISARALTIRQGERVIRWGFAWDSFSPAEIVELRFGALVDDTSMPPAPLFTQPQVAATVQWLSDLAYRDRAITLEPMVPEDTAAMWSSTVSTWQAYARQQDVGIVPYPVDEPSSKTTRMYLEQVAMSSGALHPEAAWRWIDFLSRQPPSRPGWMPARRSVTEATGLWDGLDEELKSALRFAQDHAIRLSLRNWGTAYESLDAELRAAFRGEKSIEDALAAAQSRATTQLEAQSLHGVTVAQAPVIATGVAHELGEGTFLITFIPHDAATLQNLDDAAQRFHVLHPDVMVKIESPSIDSDIAGLAERADCFQAVPYLDTPEILGAIRSLDHLLDADPAFDLSDFFPSMLALYERQGQLWGVPAETHPYVIEYNPSSFDAAGQAYPGLDWTTDDFLSLAKALMQERGDTKQYGFVNTYELLDLLLFVERLGGQIVDGTQTPPSTCFDNPATVEAVTWYANLYLAHKVKPSCITEGSNCEALIETGRAAMWSRPLYHGEPASWVLPFPKGAGGRGVPILYTTGYFISARTETPRACWDWIKFLSTEADVAQGMPVRRSVVNSEAYRQQVGVELAAAYLASIEDGETSDLQYLLGQDWLSPYLLWLEQAYREIVEEWETPERALTEAQQKANEYRTCVMTRDALYDRVGWEGCLREVDPTLPEALFVPGD